MCKRKSPLEMGLAPERILEKDGWEIALGYVGEMRHNACFVADLSHVPKWTLQGPDLDTLRPAGMDVPAKVRAAVVSNGTFLVRLGPCEARLMMLGPDQPQMSGFGVTDVTEAYASLAIVGPACYALLSMLSKVDLARDLVPSAALAPVEDVTCLIAQLRGQGEVPGLVISCARGYGPFLVEAVVDAGREYGIQPAGWDRFESWMTP